MRDAAALEAMTRTEGWQVFERHVRARIEDNKNKLLTCNGWDDVLKHRAKVEALSAELLFVSQTIEKGIESNESAD